MSDEMQSEGTASGLVSRCGAPNYVSISKCCGSYTLNMEFVMCEGHLQKLYKQQSSNKNSTTIQKSRSHVLTMAFRKKEDHERTER